MRYFSVAWMGLCLKSIILVFLDLMGEMEGDLAMRGWLVLELYFLWGGCFEGCEGIVVVVGVFEVYVCLSEGFFCHWRSCVGGVD